LTGQVMVCCAHGSEISAAIVGGVFMDPLTTTSFSTKLYIERKDIIGCLQLIQISEVPLQILFLISFSCYF